MVKRGARVLFFAIAAALAATVLLWYAVVREDRAGTMTVSFLNIGQGDATFIEAPSGRQVLIDGGSGRIVLRELSHVMPWWDRSVDVVVATHPDLDHIGGLVDVLARHDVSLIVESSVKDEEGADAKAFEAAATKENAERIIARRGTVIDLGGGARIEFLSPDRDVPRVETNLGCLVARVVYGSTSFMLTCDAPQAIEKYLAALDGEKLQSDVLKIGHHGSRTSSAPLFVGYVSPEWAVFSRGCDNSYGHPHQEVVELFKRFEIPTLDTCTDGRVTFVSDGQTVSRR